MSATLIKLKASTHNQRTKKNQNSISNEEKSKLWAMFDAEKEETQQEDSENQGTICSYCNHILMIAEDGLPTCSNRQCGIIYTDMLDYSAEWRTNLEDKNGSDNTRCGNPINPLLKVKVVW